MTRCIETPPARNDFAGRCIVCSRWVAKAKGYVQPRGDGRRGFVVKCEACQDFGPKPEPEP